MHMLTVAARVQMTPGRVKRALLLSMTLAAMPVEAPAAAARDYTRPRAEQRRSICPSA